MNPSADVVICGAGIAGISAAYHLAVRHGMHNVVLCDPRPPLSLTSDKSTECYRNWWPDPAMAALMNRSIDLLEGLAGESGNVFNLSRRGYLYLTGQESRLGEMQAAAEKTSALGGGPLRVHGGATGSGAHRSTGGNASGEADGRGAGYEPAHAEGYTQGLSGADLILDRDLLHHAFPYLGESALAGLHVRRAGWFSAQQLGAYLLEAARRCGASVIPAAVSAVESAGGRVQAVRLEDGRRLETRGFVNASGPLLQDVGRMLGVELPVFSELHLKAVLKDPRRAVPRHAPLLIWTDPQFLPWSDDERDDLAQEEDTRWLLEEFPGGAHTRPEGGADADVALMLWEYRTHRLDPTFPLPLDPLYPEIVLRGLSAMLPRLGEYFGRLSRPNLDGGYYLKTVENRPLIGPLPLEGAYVLGALSGFGLMAACAAGELLAANVTASPLPGYAPAFRLERYEEPGYLAAFGQGGGQL